MKIQEDGRQKRAAAEVELVQLENDIKKKCWSFLQADSTDTFVFYIKNGEAAFSVVSPFFTSCLTLISGVLPFHSFFGIP